MVVLGYIIDPMTPNLTTLEIAERLARDSNTFDDLLSNIFGLSGRYVIIYWSEKEAKLVHDPCALRKAFYFFGDKNLFCASQPGLIKNFHHLDGSQDLDLVDFISSEKFLKNESFWVGDETVYHNVKQLMPNFYLDLRSKNVNRYWVNNPEKLGSLDEAVKEISTILKGSIDAASRQRLVMQSVTAGWDSRVLLAASKCVSKRILYFVNTMNVYKDNHMDIAVPKKMLGDMGLEVNIFREMPKLRDEFYEVMKMNVEGARKLPKTLAIQYYHDFHYGKLNINGNGSEIVRCYYGEKCAESSMISSSYVIKKAGLDQDSTYLHRKVEDWLADVRDLVEEQDLNVMDLFYWEQRMGNWGGMFMSEQDVAVEGFMPFNNRRLLVLALGLDDKYRVGPDHILHKKLIKEMWPELLEYPINPDTLKVKIRNLLVTGMPEGMKEVIKNILRS